MRMACERTRLPFERDGFADFTTTAPMRDNQLTPRLLGQVIFS